MLNASNRKSEIKTFQSLWLFIKHDIVKHWTRLTNSDVIYINGNLARLAKVVSRRYNIEYSLAYSTAARWFNSWRSQAFFRSQLV